MNEIRNTLIATAFTALFWPGVVGAADADGDLMEDAWEATYGLSSTDRNDAFSDADGDGQIARDEYFSDTHPGLSGSLLELSQISVSAAGLVSVAWSTDVRGQTVAPTYDLLALDQQLVSGGTWQTLQSDLAGGGATTSTTDDLSGSSAFLRFYRPVVHGATHAGTVTLGAVAKYSLPEGKSYIGVPLDPVSHTLSALLGTDQLPGGDTLANATTVDVWDQTTQTISERYWLSNVAGSEGWFKSDAATSADNEVVDLSKGIIVTVRAGAGTQSLYVAGTVPKIPDSQAIAGPGYTLASLQYPSPLTLADSELVADGFQGHSGVGILSDWVMFFNATTGLFDTKVWFETGTQTWRYLDGAEEAGDLVLTPGQPFLIRRRAGTDFTWSNPYPGTPSITITAEDPVAAEQEGKAGKIRIRRTGSLEPLTIDFSIAGNLNPILPSADTNEFTLRDGTYSNEVSGKFHIPFGVAFADIMIEPNDDGVAEAAEAITFNIDPIAEYSLGIETQAVVKIGDRSNVESNQIVYIAYLRPQGMVESTGFGIATVRLRGDNDVGVLNLSFSGLTTPQSDVHIHRVDNNAIVQDLPLGQLSNYQWELEPFGGFTTELDVINALKSGALYLNVHSDLYPHGEIVGTFTESIGSTELQVPPDPPPLVTLTAEEQEQDIARFLNQCTFGATTSTIAEVQAYIDSHGNGTNRVAGMSAWLDEQMDPALVPQTLQTPVTKSSYFLNNPINGQYHREENYAWMEAAVHGKDQVRQRVATALSEIFVTSSNVSAIPTHRSRWSSSYYDMLARDAFGSYSNLLYNVSTSPVMGRYLSHIQNVKAVTNAMGEVLSSPDENYAREIMQLFSVGLVKLHQDGNIHLGENGLPIETYSLDTITEVAKIFTGWSFGVIEDGVGGVKENTSFFLHYGSRDSQVRLLEPMKMWQEHHDETAKVTLEGHVIPAGQTGEKDLADFIEILGDHANTAPTISRKLIQRLVTSAPSAGYVYRVSNAWTASNGDFKTVLKAILFDYEARNLDPATDAHISFGKLREPMMAYVAMLRTFDATSQVPLSQLVPHGYPASELAKFPAGQGRLRLSPNISQTIMFAPSVFNFFLPEYNPPGPMAVAGISAPEFQIVTEAKMYDRFDENYASIFTTRDGDQFNGMTAAGSGYTNESDDLILSMQSLIDLYDAEATDAEGSEAVIDYLDLILMGGRLQRIYEGAAAPNPRSLMIDLGTNLNNPWGKSSVTTEDRVENMLYVFLCSPDFAIQR